MTNLLRFVLPPLLLLLSACANDPGTGPVEIEWEHATCQRCNMVLSDSFHAAQVRRRPVEGPSQVYLFDDVGCAVIWLQDKPWKDAPTTEIWVNDFKTGAWLDARQAHYVGGQRTPMLYGLGAQTEATPGSVDFDQAKRHIFAVEQRLQQHGGH